MAIDEVNSRLARDLLRPGSSSADGARAGRACGPVQGPRGSNARRNHQLPLGGGRGVRLQPDCGVRALAADDLAPSEDPAGGRPGRLDAARDVVVLPARPGSRCGAQRGARRVNVLFVCKQNAGRSQIAQALYERRGGNARSAGTTPAERVHPEVAQLMPELTDRIPKRLERSDAEWADLVVTMGCGDACPVILGKQYVDWELQDPVGQDIEAVRRIRDEIERRVAEL